MSSIAQVFCVFCMALSGPPNPQLSRESDGVRYTHEILSGKKHLLRLSTGYSLFDSDGAEYRMAAFAAHFAADTCPRRFVFEARRSRMPTLQPALAKSFVFRCR